MNQEATRNIILKFCLDTAQEALRELDLDNIDTVSDEEVAKRMSNCSNITGHQLVKLGSKFLDYRLEGREIDEVIRMSGLSYESFGSFIPAYELYKHIGDNESVTRLENISLEVYGLTLNQAYAGEKEHRHVDYIQRISDYCKKHNREYYMMLREGLIKLVSSLQPILAQTVFEEDCKKLSSSLKQLL